MTSKLTQQAGEPRVLEKFPDFPPRDDMQNALHLYDDGHQAVLRRHFGNLESTIILSEIPVRQTPGRQGRLRIPDMLVAFNVDRPLAVEQNGYSIRDQGKPPDLVLEVASATTADQDVGNKRLDYAAFGIPEYWQFDPTGGQRYDAPIAGDRLENGEYHPMRIEEIGPDHFHGSSVVLNPNPCWDHRKLRWYDPATQAHLLTFAEEQEARITAEARVRELEAELENRQQG